MKPVVRAWITWSISRLQARITFGFAESVRAARTIPPMLV